MSFKFGNKYRVVTYVSEETFDAIESARGEKSQSAFVNKILVKELGVC